MDSSEIIAREERLIAALQAQGHTATLCREFRSLVLGYYAAFGRPLPWRETTDPYRILVSEVMLQQTQVERVRVKYPDFIAQFPHFPALADAPRAEVLRAWKGMGYNRRAIALQKCAAQVVREHHGVLPRNPDDLCALPGIGQATAHAILVYAFNIPAPFIEVNVRRVFIHVFFPGAESVPDADLLPLVRVAMPAGDPRTWGNALMDYGTFLKKRSVTASHRSATYRRQPRFAGSNRQLRGRVLWCLTAHGSVEYESIPSMVVGEPPRVYRVVDELADEGFIIREGHNVRLAGCPHVP
jgi:A/G-specific adenine glycosylase